MCGMATRLLLVRHGGTIWTIENRFAGSVDVPLSDEGRAQAAALGRRLASTPIAAAYCSPMQRAIDTATIVCGPHKLTPVQREGLREIDHGKWEGRKEREVREEAAGAYAAWEADPYLVGAPGGDTGLAVLSRAMPAFRQIVADHPGQTVLVVSHKATLRLVLCSYLGIDPSLYRERLAQDPACLNTLEFLDTTHARMTLMNDTSHYAVA
jgi:broad specificity phosphatase PhoE